MAIFIEDDISGLAAGCHELPDPVELPFPGIGRSEKNYFPINNPYLSAYHAEFMCRDGVWHIADRGSRNGTWLNGQWLKPNDYEPLTNLSRIMLGKGPTAVKMLWLDNCKTTAPSEVFADQGWPRFVPTGYREDTGPGTRSETLIEFDAPESGPWPLLWGAAVWNYILRLPGPVRVWLIFIFGVSSCLSGGYWVYGEYEKRDLARINRTASVLSDPWLLVQSEAPQTFTTSRKVQVKAQLEMLRSKTNAARAVMRIILPNQYGMLAADVRSPSQYDSVQPIPATLWMVDLQTSGYRELLDDFRNDRLAIRIVSELPEDSPLRQSAQSRTATRVIYSVASGDKYYLSVDYEDNNGITQTKEQQIEFALRDAIFHIDKIMGYSD